jgi:hypothetical protein
MWHINRNNNNALSLWYGETDAIGCARTTTHSSEIGPCSKEGPKPTQTTDPTHHNEKKLVRNIIMIIIIF